VKVIRGLDSPQLHLSKSVLTIGNFDGVHRGHQQIIAQAGMFAANLDAPTVAVTFDPHPIRVLAPAKAPPRLTPLAEKLNQLAAAGADITVVCDATSGVLAWTAEEFVRRVVDRLHPQHIVEGRSFGFGRGRKGTVDTLRELGKTYHYEVFVVDPVRLQIDPETTLGVSSSIVRDLIRRGRVHRAALCLGREYALFGTVVAGAGRGKGLGFPTANLQVDDQLIPGDGVYAGRACPLDADRQHARLAAISIGRTPTFAGAGGEPPRQVEAFLLDTEENFYDRPLRLEFGRRLRDQIKFDSAEALARQIEQDVAGIRAYQAESAGK
jgi:riboflavin kinase / FMN adenylyltransferase